MIFVAPVDLGAELEAIAEIDDLRRQLRWRVVDGPRRWYGGLRRLVFAKAVQGSNAIEGYHATTDDVLAAVEDEETFEASPETRHALEGYRDAMTYVVQLANDGSLDVDESLLRSLHFMMLKHDLSKRPGRWRAGDVFVKREPSGEIVYEAPDVSTAPALISELIENVNGHDGPLLVRAAMAHLNLTMVHPFKDGNGRMARCLQTLVLAREKVVAPVFSSIEEEIGRDAEAYYAVLGDVGRGSWRPENDARPWIRYCLNCHYRQAQRVLRRVREAEDVWARFEQLVGERGLPARAVGPLCDASRGLRMHNWSYRLAVEESEGHTIDPAMASRDLKALVNAGLLAPRGETRGRYYLGTPDLTAVRREVRTEYPIGPVTDLFETDGQRLPPMPA
jgi:Fic family protein